MKRSVVAIGFAMIAVTAHAIEVDAGECREASQFIGNAAQSRENGATKEMFVGKLDEDLFVLESIAPEHRWFVHGEDEAQFLREAVLDVFDFPREPSKHAAEFLKNCLMSAGLAPQDAGPAQNAPQDAPRDGRSGPRGRV